MGQYHIAVNFDKKEVIHPHTLGQGLKLWEQMWGPPGVPFALHILLACSNGRGGGDFSGEGIEDNPLIGRWAGDRIAVVGDYAEAGDIADLEFDVNAIYDLALDAHELMGKKTPAGWRDISWDMAKLMEKMFEGKFKVPDYAKEEKRAKLSWMTWEPKTPTVYKKLKEWVETTSLGTAAAEVKKIMETYQW